MSEEEGQGADVSAPAPNMKVSELGPYSKQVNTTVKVVQKGEARETVSRQDGTTHRVLDALVGDDSGTIYMTLWDENIDKVNEGDTLNVKNGYVRPFKGSMRLNVGRYGSLEPAETPLGDVNTQNNLSDKVVEERPYRSYGGGGRRFGGGGYGRGGGGYGRGGYGRGRGRGYGGGRGRGRDQY
ncbi:MAG TPA: single-stranded DNA-binding protein [Candidatus Dormibacteraeota bacterium]|nr:single-stranded DNA-binding protein [Candidatus Dormibacteraeota bacterium]